MQLVLFQENLLPRLEGRHPQVRAAGAAECIPQVALARERKAPSVIRGNVQFSPPVIPFFPAQEITCSTASISTETTSLLPPLNTCLVSAVSRAVQGTVLMWKRRISTPASARGHGCKLGLGSPVTASSSPGAPTR